MSSLRETGNLCLEAITSLSEGFNAAGEDLGKSPTWPEEQLMRFNLWAADTGLFLPGRAALDYKLRENIKIRSIVTGLLESIQDNAHACLEISGLKRSAPPRQETKRDSWDPSGNETRSDDSDSTNASMLSDANKPEHGLADFAHGIEDGLTYLVRLAGAIKEHQNAKTEDKIDEVAADANLGFEQIAEIRKILESAEYKDADVFIKERLESTMLRRSRRISYYFSKTIAAREQPDISETDIDRATFSTTSVVASPPASTISRLSKMSSKLKHTLSLMPKFDNRTIRTGRTAVTAVKSESSYDSPAPNTTREEAEVDHSSLFGVDQDFFPQRPNLGSGQTDFWCSYCASQQPRQTAGTDTSWRLHVMHDLAPYICPYEKCPRPDDIYHNSTDWHKHMKDDHSQTLWHCSACKVRCLTAEAFISHLASHLGAEVTKEELSLIVQMSVVKETASDPMRCPLCTATFEYDHFAEHLRALAIISLPEVQDGDSANFSRMKGGGDESEKDSLSTKRISWSGTTANSASAPSFVTRSSFQTSYNARMAAIPNLKASNVQYSGADEVNYSGVHRIIIGVDFGTTYTSVSWVSSENASSKTVDDIHCIRDWPGPGRDADYSWSTPSRLAYGFENSMSRNAWGFEVLPRMKSYSWMKLLLDENQASYFNDSSLAANEGDGVLRTPYDTRPVDLCADFLAEVSRFVHDTLRRRISAETLAATPLEFWFTVPAVWSDKAKSDTRYAAKRAAEIANVSFHPGTVLYLIPEPEAAAIATFSTLTQGGSQRYVRVGDGLIVCDCGGEIVDLTTYEIEATAPRLMFKELVVGTGGKCGSTYIDREFIKWMERKFGRAFTSLSWKKKGPASRLMKDFEITKSEFGTSKDSSRYYELRLLMREAEDSEYYDEDSGIVKIYEKDMLTLFEPVVNKVVDLIQGQWDAVKRQGDRTQIKTVILVGGFSESAYLYDCVQGWCKRHNVRLLCPEHPQAAIVRGAALSGLQDIRPTTRRARRHYGFSFHHAFDRTKHREEDKFIWDWDGSLWADNQMEWQLAKGDIVDEQTKIEQQARRTMYDHGDKRTSLEVYCCDADEAPPFRNSPGVRKLATINLDYSEVNLRDFPSKIKDDGTIRLVNEVYKIYFGQRRGVLCFSAHANGKEIGNTTVSFDGREGTSGPTSAASMSARDGECAVM